MISALIVDDETPARQRLRTLLAPFIEAGRIALTGEARDGIEAMQHLEKQPVDLLFLDVQMPEMDGFGVLERLSPKQTPVVIFTTAYDQYALKAFRANAVDYLLKPISTEELEEAIGRAERLIQQPQERAKNEARFGDLLDWLDQQMVQNPHPVSTAYLQQVSIPFRDRILVVHTRQILCAEVRDGITRLVVLNEKTGQAPKAAQYIVNYTLEQLEERLDPQHFMRVHRSALVQLDHIKEMIAWFSGRYKIILTTNHEVIASRERSKLLKKRLTL